MNTALAAQTNGPATWGYMGPDMESAGKLAKALVATGLAPSGMTAGQAFYVMLAGAELGLRGPIEALRHVVVIKGKPSISAELMRSMMLAAGCKLDWLRSDSTGATLKITRPDGSTGTFTFDEKDAQRAGLLNNNTWKSYPNAMYQARVTSLAARAFCPDMLRGASYTPEELGAKANVTGDGDIEYVQGTARDVTNDHDDDPSPNGNGAPAPPALPEPDPAVAQDIASSAQVKALAILATRKLAGITREDRLKAYSGWIGREIETSSELAVPEWRLCVEALNKMPDAPKKAVTDEGAEGGGVEGAAGSPSGANASASDDDPHGLWGKGEPEPEPEWKKLTKPQQDMRDKVVRLAKSVGWINVEEKTVLCPQAIRECFTVDPGPYIDPARIVTRPAPAKVVAMYEEAVETERAEQLTR